MAGDFLSVLENEEARLKSELDQPRRYTDN